MFAARAEWWTLWVGAPLAARGSPNIYRSWLPSTSLLDPKRALGEALRPSRRPSDKPDRTAKVERVSFVDPKFRELESLSIDRPYLLVNRIVLYRAPSGELFYPPLWAKDLVLHTAYIKNLSLCCPISSAPPPQDYVPASQFPELAGLRVRALYEDVGWGQVARHLLPNLRIVREEVERAELVHSGAAGWPFPASYYLLLLRGRRPTWLMNVESTFWMVNEHERASNVRKLSSRWNLNLVRRCLKQADLRFFTNRGYQELLSAGLSHSYVVPATWIDAELIRTDDELEADRDEKLDPARPAKFIFPARLEPEKGVHVLMRAIERLNQLGVSIQIDFMGTGSLEQECRRFVQQTEGSVTMSFLDQVPYGKAFFSRLSRYDAVLVPSLSAEQPRIVFDAYSQGVPVIAADTAGNSEVVEPEKTGVLFRAGDALELANVIGDNAQDRVRLEAMGRSALSVAREMTHAGMHVTRARILREFFDAERGAEVDPVV